MTGLDGSQITNKSLTIDKVIKNVLSDNTVSRNLLVDGVFSADESGRRIMQDGYVTDRMLQTVPLEKFTNGFLIYKDEFYETNITKPTSVVTDSGDYALQYDQGTISEATVLFDVPTFWDNDDITFKITYSTSDINIGNPNLIVNYSINDGQEKQVIITNIPTLSSGVDQLSFLSLTSDDITSGDEILFKIKRLNNDSYTGKLFVYDVRMLVSI